MAAMDSYRSCIEAPGKAVEISPASREWVAQTPRYSLPLGNQNKERGAARDRNGVTRAKKGGERKKMRSRRYGHAVKG